jgi:YD repeat-containing protein
LGNITSQTDAGGATTFTYDALYRLTNADYPGTADDQGYTYDKVGNRKTMTKGGATLAYVYDVDNRLKEIHQNTTGGALLNKLYL